MTQCSGTCFARQFRCFVLVRASWAKITLASLFSFVTRRAICASVIDATGKLTGVLTGNFLLAAFRFEFSTRGQRCFSWFTLGAVVLRRCVCHFTVSILWARFARRTLGLQFVHVHSFATFNRFDHAVSWARVPKRTIRASFLLRLLSFHHAVHAQWAGLIARYLGFHRLESAGLTRHARFCFGFHFGSTAIGSRRGATRNICPTHTVEASRTRNFSTHTTIATETGFAEITRLVFKILANCTCKNTLIDVVVQICSSTTVLQDMVCHTACAKSLAGFIGVRIGTTCFTVVWVIVKHGGTSLVR